MRDGWARGIAEGIVVLLLALWLFCQMSHAQNICANEVGSVSEKTITDSTYDKGGCDASGVCVAPTPRLLYQLKLSGPGYEVYALVTVPRAVWMEVHVGQTFPWPYGRDYPCPDLAQADSFFSQGIEE